jgi:NADH-quinone oxidoreductase subunit G
MQAHLDVSEPKPLSDNNSPLTYTMEGYKGIPPSSLIPFYWSPGWNSVQSVSKFQDEPGGALKDGDPGIRLFKETGAEPIFFESIPEAFTARQQKWLVLPQYDVLGSGELSIYTKAVKDLSPQPYVFLSAHDAELLGIINDALVTISVSKNQYTLPVKIKKGLREGLRLIVRTNVTGN